ncbi:hypothetical protein J437_LFUL012136 [Ladona fulva]|uniref:Uncharacterized protein n=1 Tax=Ladona fulva TaxID=123851 RepID=A0A8K0KBW6_LADFU|nr:hypothetical protein J437_LFUL012136 [Ladona fulva]
MEFLRKGTAINADCYRSSVRALRKTPCTTMQPLTRNTQPRLQHCFRGEVWQHPECRDPCDFHAFVKLEEHLGGHEFASNDQIRTGVCTGSITKERISIVKASIN